MNYLGLIFGILILGVIAYLWSRRKPKQQYGEYDIPGLCKVRWLIEDHPWFNGELIGKRLHNVKLIVWSQFEEIYGKKVNCLHGNIVLDPYYHKVAEMTDVDRTRNIIINPTLEYEKGYASELHNLIRYTLYGFHNVYSTTSDKDKKNYTKANRIIKGL